MSTSLAEQLKRLAIPQTKVLTDAKQRASLLFDPLEAAKLSKDVVYQIGIEGLNEIISFDKCFIEFRSSLFNYETKFVQRAIESKEVNKKLDKLISKFLIRLSPYLLLKSTHKALEWLIYRYRIHEMNVAQLLSLILPYHEANVFVKILQLIDLKPTSFKSWRWLEPIQKQGLQLPRQVLINHAITDTSFLRFICEFTENHLKEHLKTRTESKLRTQLGFYTSALVGVFSGRATNDHVLSVALPSLLTALTSTVDDYKAASYMAFGQLISNNQLDVDLLNKLLQSIMEDTSENFQNQRVYLLLLMFQRQEPPPVVSYEMMKKWEWVVPVLTDLSLGGILVGPLLLILVQTLIHHIFKSSREESNDAHAQVFCWNILEDVQFDDFSACKMFRILAKHYEKFNPSSRGLKRKKPADEIDVICGVAEADWLKVVVENFCSKYAPTFEKVQDQEFQNLRRQWVGEDQEKALDGIIVSLVRKCSGSSHADAWRQLKPILMKQIDDKRYFKAWCKASPVSEPVTLLLILERFLRFNGNPASRRLLLAKVSDFQFGSRSPCIGALKTTLENKPEIDAAEAMQIVLDTWKKEPSSRYPLPQWISAINELRNSGQFSSVNEIWPYALRMLIYCLNNETNSQQSVEVAMALSFVATVKAKAQVPIIAELLDCVRGIEYLEEGWVDLSKADLTTCLRIKALELMLRGIHESLRLTEEFSKLLDKFLLECFPNIQVALRFVSAVAAGLPYSTLTSSLMSPLLQIHAIHLLWKKSSVSDSEDIINLWEQLVIHVILALSSESMSVREAASRLVRRLASPQNRARKLTHAVLLHKLANRWREMTADAKHICVGLHCLLSPDGSNMSKNLDSFTAVLVAPETPLYVAAKLATLLETVVSVELVKQLAPLARRALNQKGEVHIGNRVLATFWQRLNTNTSKALEDSEVWNLACESLAHYKCDELCPAITLIKVINKDIFYAVPVPRRIALLELLVRARAETESAAVSSAVATACRKLPLNGAVVLPLLQQMVQALPKDLSSLPNTVLDEKSWRAGMSLLEIIQSKKKLSESAALVRPLFGLLKFCLDQEEQTPFEYAKQLVLGCLLEVCERHLAGTDHVEAANLDVELIVQCLRASSNPQTHHHALLLLSCLGSIIPVQVMHNMMAIFTFMGSSVARLDDEHSVQVVTKVVDAIVPVLVQSLSSNTSGTDSVVAEVLRIFVWTLRDVPQHRREPLFTRLITTLDPDRSLHIFLLLLFENYVVNAHKAEKNSEGSMPPSLQLGLVLALSFGPQVVLKTALKLLQYLIAIPLDKMNPARPDEPMDTDEDSDGLFDIKKHTPKQLRHYTYTLFTFLNSLLAEQTLIIQVRELDSSEAEKLESVFKDAMAALLVYAPTCAAQQHPQLAKYWKIMTQLGYDALDRLVALVSSDTLVGVITKLLSHSEDALRRKAVDLLNVHVQTHRGGFTTEEKTSLNKLVVPVLEVATSMCAPDASADAQATQQAALLSLRLLAKVLAADDPLAFKNVLVEVSKLSKSKGNLLASVALTVADLVAHLRVRAVSQLPAFLPALLKVLVKYIDAESTDIVLMSVCAALYRVVESLAAFLSPYMDKLIYCVSCLATSWPDASDLNRKLHQIRQKIATNVPHRVLIPSLSRCYDLLIKEDKLSAVGQVLSLLAESLAPVPDVSKLLPDLSPFYMRVLQLRSDVADGLVEASDEDVLVVEGHAIEALLTLVLKLSELSFKPLYYQIFHWVSEHPHRAITFYRLSSKLAEGLKGLFVLFAGHFLQNAAMLLDATNVSKTDKLHFGDGPENEAKAILLLESIIQTLYTVFMFDSTQFLSKEKFQSLLSPLVDQLENTIGGAEALNERSKRLVTPCLAQMTLATEDTQWKQLNYQLLTKTRSTSPLIRICALNTIVEVAAKLGEEYLPLLPETIGSLAELLEDEDERVEEAMKEALRRMEDDLGQPIREYFQ